MAKTPTPAKVPAATSPATDPVQPELQQPTAEQPEAEPTEVGTVPARVLVDHGRHRCNTLALLTEAEAANCDAWADTSREAVEYAASITDPETLARLADAAKAD